MDNHTVVPSTCSLCQIGCGVLVHVKYGQVVKVEGNPENPLNKGILCPKGLASLEYLYHPDRLKRPLKRQGKRGDGKWKEIGWDEALDTVAAGLTDVKDRYGVESVTFIDGSFKGGYIGQYITRFANLFGSPNIITMGHVCFRPRVLASILTYGFYAIPDYDFPPAGIVVWGKNPSNTLHHVSSRITQAVERGTRLMVIDPTRTAETALADLWLQPRPGSDLALALGMINVIINEGLCDEAFVRDWTVGFDALKEHVQAYTVDKVSQITWIATEHIEQAARFYASNRPACIQWGNAIDQGVNNFQTARAMCILRAITGNLEVPGGETRWTPPAIVGHPLGPSAPTLDLPEKIPAEVRHRSIGTGESTLPIVFSALPQGIVKAILTGEPYPVRAAYIQACNPLLTYTNVRELYRALFALDFLAVADLFMTPTAALADIVLPATSYLEFDDIIAPPYSLSIALAQQRVTRIEDCRSDYEMLRDLAQRLGFGDYFWDNEEQALDFILEPVGISFAKFRKIGILQGSQQYHGYLTAGFARPFGKVELYSSQMNKWGFSPLPIYQEPPETPQSQPELTSEYPLVFTNYTPSVYRHSGGRQIKSLRELRPEPLTIINLNTADKLGITDGDKVYIETKRGCITQTACLSKDVDPRVVMVDYGWWFPEGDAASLYDWDKSNINILTDDHPPFGREIGSPNMRGTMCRVYKAPQHTEA